MKIFYRVSPYLSSNPNPLGTNKWDIVDRCFRSFAKFGARDITIIADALGTEQRRYFNGLEIVEAEGNVGTFHKQLDLICNLPNEENVMLVEDDYLWRADCLEPLERALDELILISPYDHPGHYMEDRFKYENKQMRMIDNRTYRTAPSNTLTFACKAWVIKQNIDKIRSYGIQDHPMFQNLGIQMWVPVPSFATHLVTGLLAPNIDWFNL